MRHLKSLAVLTAILLCVSFSASALTEGALTRLWGSGCDLLFHTDNVTVKGEATFFLDGERFKTAQLHYVQDGYDSYYGLKLLSPRASGGERENGWIIVANRSAGHTDIAAIELYQPVQYHTGTDMPNNTLLRRSVQLDALTELGGLLIRQLEPAFPEGCVTANESDGGTAVHIALADGQIPDVAASALNVGLGYLSDRWFSYGRHDRSVTPEERARFEDYFTATQALTDGTVKWTLRGIDADFTCDAQNRLTGARGSLRVASEYWDGAVREVEVRFDLAMTDYGASAVQPFNLVDYGVSLAND